MGWGLDDSRLRDILDRLGVGVAAALTLEGEVVFGNGCFAAWFPAGPDGEGTLPVRLGGFDAARAIARLRGGGTFRFEATSLGAGRPTPVTVTLLPFPEAGEAAVLAQCHDASEQRRTEFMLDSYSRIAEQRAGELEHEKKRIEALLAEISETRGRLTEAVEAISEGLSLHDAQGTLVLRNSRYEALFSGGPGAEANADALAPGCGAEPGRYAEPDAGSRVAQLPDGRWMRVSEQRPSGSWMRVSEQRTPSGGVVATYADITELKLRELELAGLVASVAEARDVAQAASRTKSSFLANMSHELRTPLNAIIGYSQILGEDAREEGNEGVVADLGRIEGAGTHLLSLIDHILDLSKIEAGKAEVVAEPFDLGLLLGEIGPMIELLAARNNNAFELHCPPDLGWMCSDATKLRQCLLNLLGNACKFTRDGRVTLEVLRESGVTRFTVCDDGIGIPAEQQGRLFQPFQQADSMTTRQYGGTGLGLALTRSFARLLGGEVSVRSAPGEGSAFTLCLPDTMPTLTHEAPVEPQGDTERVPGPDSAEVT